MINSFSPIPMNDLAVLLLGEIKDWSLFGLNNLRYFRQSKDVAFIVVFGIGLPVSISTHQQ